MQLAKLTRIHRRSVFSVVGVFGVLFCVSLQALGTPSPSSNDLYVAQNSAGGANGADCADALPVSWFNSASNWGGGGGQIGPGTTVHLCGTFTGAANTNLLVIQGNGTPGNPITILWEAGTVLQEPYCPAQGFGGCVQVGGHSYITLDGGTNGVIQNTANGTGLANQQGSTAVEDDGGTYLTVKNLTIRNIYVHSSPADVTVGNSSANCVYDNGSATGWQILNNTMHDMSWCVEIQYDNTSNVTISGNEIYNVDHGIAFGGPNPGRFLSGVNISRNKIHDYSNWDTGANDYHHDGVHIWGQGNNGSDSITNVNIYDNMFGGCLGQNVTAHVFIENNSGGTSNVSVYNNTFIDTCSSNENNGMIAVGADLGYRIYNNTFLGAATDTCVGTAMAPGVTFINNVVSGCGTLVYVTAGGGFAPGGLNSNVYSSCPGSNCFVYRGNYSQSLSSWQSETGQDADSSVVTNLGLNGSGVPSSSSAVIGKAINLSNISLLALNTDIIGTPRPIVGAWTAGAYSPNSSASVPAPPTNLRVTVQ